MNKLVHQSLTGVGIFCLIAGIGVGARDYLSKPTRNPAIASTPPMIPKSGELTSVSKDNKTWVVVKIWDSNGRLAFYNPDVPPSTDLRVIEDAIALNPEGIILETGNIKGNPVWGHFLKKTTDCGAATISTIPLPPCSKDNYRAAELTQAIVNANPDIFKALRGTK